MSLILSVFEYLDLTGTRLVFPAKVADGSEQLAMRRLDQSAVSFLAGTEGAVGPIFSPDGQWIGFFRILSPQNKTATPPEKSGAFPSRIQTWQSSFPSRRRGDGRFEITRHR
jgi:hypothetical protein